GGGERGGGGSVRGGVAGGRLVDGGAQPPAAAGPDQPADARTRRLDLDRLDVTQWPDGGGHGIGREDFHLAVGTGTDGAGPAGHERGMTRDRGPRHVERAGTGLGCVAP